MSKFNTSIKVDTKAVLDALPQGAYINGITFDKETETVQVKWEHDKFRSPFTFETEFPLADLKAGKLPDKITLTGDRPTTVPIAPAPRPTTKAGMMAESKEAADKPDKPAPVAHKAKHPHAR